MRRLAAFAVIALFVAYLVAPPAGAAFPGANGKIVYVKATLQGGTNIFTIDPDGTDRTRLTSADSDNDPAWSADGLQIAFGGFPSYPARLFVMDADGSNVSTVITADDLPPYWFTGIVDPSWSPDGTMLAFCSYNTNSGKWKVFTVGTDGLGLTKLSGASDNDCAPAWSPDGTTIAIESFDPESAYSDIVLLAADGSTREALVTVGDNQAPNWSPTGAKLTFTKGHLFIDGGFRKVLPTDIYTVNADGSGIAQVTSTRLRWEMQPAWSPDGTRIAFSRSTGKVEFGAPCLCDLLTIAPDGSDLDRVTDTTHTNELSPDWQPA